MTDPTPEELLRRAQAKIAAHRRARDAADRAGDRAEHLAGRADAATEEYADSVAKQGTPEWAEACRKAWA